MHKIKIQAFTNFFYRIKIEEKKAIREKSA